MIGAGLVVLVLLIDRLQSVIVPVVLAVLLATALAPLVAGLRARGWRRTRAALTVFLGALVALIALIAALVVQVVDQLDELTGNISDGVDELERWLIEGPLSLSPDTIDDLRARLGGELAGSGDQVASGAAAAFELVAGIVIALFVTFFLLRDGDIAWRGLLGLVPARHRDDAAEIGQASWRTVGAFLRGTAVVGLIDAVLIAIALLILDVPLVSRARSSMSISRVDSQARPGRRFGVIPGVLPAAEDAASRREAAEKCQRTSGAGH